MWPNETDRNFEVFLPNPFQENLPNSVETFDGGSDCLRSVVGSMNDLSMYIHIMYIHIPMNTPRQPRKTLRTDARALIEACAGWNSRLAARRITQFLDREMMGLGLTAAQLGLMAQIAITSDDTLGALAQRMGLDQSTLSRNLRTLEGEGLIEIAVVETDLRRRAVWLTETGARRLEAAIPVWRRAHTKLAKLLSPHLARRLADGAEALIGGLT